MMDFKAEEVWFVTGSQHLYGDVALKQVAEHSQIIARGLAESGKLPRKGCVQAGRNNASSHL